MGSFVSTNMERRKAVITENKSLMDLESRCGNSYPCCDHQTPDRKNWMRDLSPEKLHINQIVWPGTHDSATNRIGIPLITRPFAQCQNMSIYRQLCAGTRVLDIRVEENRRVCHGILKTYSVDVVLNDVKRFLSETTSEVIILEIRTEFGKKDPPNFENDLVKTFGEHLIHQDDHVFGKSVAELLPKRVICVWKPRQSPQPKAGGPLWHSGYLRDNWIDTDLPATKFDNNMARMADQPSASVRKFFYRVENTATPQADNMVVCVKPVTRRIRGHARLFISQAISKGYVNRLQIFSTDFIDVDFINACVGLTKAKMEGKV